MDWGETNVLGTVVSIDRFRPAAPLVGFRSLFIFRNEKLPPVKLATAWQTLTCGFNIQEFFVSLTLSSSSVTVDQFPTNITAPQAVSGYNKRLFASAW